MYLKWKDQLSRLWTLSLTLVLVYILTLSQEASNEYKYLSDGAYLYVNLTSCWWFYPTGVGSVICLRDKRPSCPLWKKKFMFEKREDVAENQ